MPSIAPFELARLTEMLMVGSERRADGAAGIARGRLDPDALEGSIAQYLAVSHAIEGDAAGKAEIVDRYVFAEERVMRSIDLLSDLLHRGREIHITLLRAGSPDRVAAHRTGRETSVSHGQSGRIVEVALVEPEGAILLEVDQVVENQICVSGLP